MHLLRSGRNMLNTHEKLIVYYAHIKSHITYGISVWRNMICNTIRGNYKKCKVDVSNLSMVTDKKMTRY